jgi:lauroyl/myristoyl acyltransferase
MKKEEYLTQKQNLINHSLFNYDLIQDDKLNRTLNFVSANLVNFIPSLETSKHDATFKQILLHRTLSSLDEQYLGVLNDNVEVEGIDRGYLDFLRKIPSIICTFHMGSSRLLNHYLMKNKVNFTLVVSGDVVKSSGDSFNKMYEEYNKELGFKENNLTIISANEPNSALKMLRELKNGKNLLIYIDGNMGSGDKSIKNENSCKVDFLEESIYARAGVAYLSYLAQVPIVEAISYRKNWEDIIIKFNKIIEPNRNIDKETYFQSTTQEIYRRFSEVLLQYPEQWEGWLNLHEVTNPKVFKNTTLAIKNEIGLLGNQLILNKRNFGVFNIDEEYFLLDKKRYISLKINKNIYKKLLYSHIEPIDSNNFGEENFLNQLIINGVLTN